MRGDLLIDVRTIGERLDGFRYGVRLIGMAPNHFDLFQPCHVSGSQSQLRSRSYDNLPGFLGLDASRQKRQQRGKKKDAKNCKDEFRRAMSCEHYEPPLVAD